MIFVHERSQNSIFSGFFRFFKLFFRHKYMLKFLKYAGIILLLAAITVLFCNVYINRSAAAFLFDDKEKLPENEYGLVLGTSKYLVAGGINDFFSGRTQTAAALFHAKKIKKLIVSGYVDHPYYNEPAQIQKELLKLGVPDTVILLDTAGYRTFSSVQNLLQQPWHGQVTIISQKFHNQRAVFLARKAGIDAVGFNVPDKHSGRVIKPYLREVLAKVLAFWEALPIRERRLNDEKTTTVPVQDN